MIIEKDKVLQTVKTYLQNKRKMNEEYDSKLLIALENNYDSDQTFDKAWLVYCTEEFTKLLTKKERE